MSLEHEQLLQSLPRFRAEPQETDDQFAERFLFSTHNNALLGVLGDNVEIFCDSPGEMPNKKAVLDAIVGSRLAKRLIDDLVLNTDKYSASHPDNVLEWISDIQSCEVYGTVCDVKKIKQVLEERMLVGLDKFPDIDARTLLTGPNGPADPTRHADLSALPPVALKLYIIGGFIHSLSEGSLYAPNLKLWTRSQ